MTKLLPMFALSIATAVMPIYTFADAQTNYVKLNVTSSDYYTVHVYDGLDEVPNNGTGTIAEGSTITIDVIAANDYKLKAIYVNNVKQDFDDTASTEISYEVGSTDVTIYAEYEAVEYSQISGTSATQRYINSISITDGTTSTTVKGLGNTSRAAIYTDQTSTVATLNVNTPIQLTVNGSGAWIESYLYIDYNNDGVFTPVWLADNDIITDVNNYIPAANSELVTHTGWTKGTSTPHYNSLGQSTGSESKTCGDSKSAPCVHTTIPTFTIPSDTEPGKYRARYMLGWNIIDPTGNTPNTGITTSNAKSTTDNSLATLGGTIIDFTIEVVRPERTVVVQSAEYDGKAEGDVAIANQTVTTVTTDGDVRMLASPKDDYAEFMYWTVKYDDGTSTQSDDSSSAEEIISTDALYTYKDSRSATLTAVFGYRVYVYKTSGGSITVAGGDPTYTTKVEPLTITNTRTNKTLSTSEVKGYDDSTTGSSDVETISGENTEGVLYPIGTRLYANLLADGTSGSSEYRIVYLAINDILYAYATENSTTQNTKQLSMGFDVTDPIYVSATFWDRTTGVQNVAVDAENAPAEYYNLQGIRVPADSLTPGLYIVRSGNTVTKQTVKY